LREGDVVKRRVLRLGLIVLSVLSLLPGCEMLDHYRRPPSPEDAKSDSDDPGVSGTKGFFKSSRVPGALSSEGREVEQSLGIR
jgi:hypothetical protein